jgi:hypothetical protein
MLTLGNTTAFGQAPLAGDDTRFMMLAACNLIVALGYVVTRAFRHLKLHAVIMRAVAYVSRRLSMRNAYEPVGEHDDDEFDSNEVFGIDVVTETRPDRSHQHDAQNRFFMAKPSLIRRILEAPSWRFSLRQYWARFIYKRTHVNKLSKRMRQRARKLAFDDHADVSTPINPGHPHAIAAYYRAQSSKIIAQFAAENSQVVAAYQSSEREHRNGAKASRDVYVKVSDFEQAPAPLQWDAPIVQFVDVIDYVTGPELALFRGKTLAAYTNQQRTLCERTEETVSYWENSTTLVEQVRGGAIYRQQPWDFSPDTFIISGATGFTIYNIERVHQPHSTRQLVFAIPAQKSTCRTGSTNSATAFAAYQPNS